MKRFFFLTTMVAFVATVPASATTKGLNQIVTPDVQPEGLLSLSLQQVHPQIDNATQFQIEYGLTKRFELSYAHGFSPSQDRLGAEYALVQKNPYLLSVGFLNFQGHSAAQPFVEGGYYKGHDQFSAGLVRIQGHSEPILGYSHTFNSFVQFSADYQQGRDNFSTVGLTFNLTKSLVFNPALYFTNSTPRHTYGYAVLTYNFDLKPNRNASPEEPNGSGTANQPASKPPSQK